MSKMIQEKKQKYSSTFKAEVALEALKADKKVAEVSEQFGISSSLVYAWRKQLVTRAREVFEDKGQIEGKGVQEFQNLAQNIFAQHLVNSLFEAIQEASERCEGEDCSYGEECNSIDSSEEESCDCCN